MTCIVAIAEGGKVWMGADSAGVGGWSLTVRKDAKMFKKGHVLIGFTDSYRMGQILGYKLIVPKHYPEDISLEAYMNTLFIDAVRTSLKENGYAHVLNNQESGGTFLVGLSGRVFKVQSDYQVSENSLPFDACGCGEDFAMGSLYNSFSLESPEARIQEALKTAEALSAGVRGPFLVYSV